MRTFVTQKVLGVENICEKFSFHSKIQSTKKVFAWYATSYYTLLV